jgi:glycosyltransferase involved in cell wall biosynthesis
MRIAFVMPSRSDVPIGAFNVVYELSNRLVERGNEVSVFHPRTKFAPRGALGRLKARAWLRRYRRRPGALAPWFRFDPRVDLRPIAYLDPAAIDPADATVAITWETPECVAAVPGRGFYLIQEGVPRPVATEAAVEAAWDQPLFKIVIAGWLEERAASRGEADRTARIPIGVDLDSFGLDRPPADRAPRAGAMLHPIKGAEEILAAFRLVRAELPGFTAVCFGTGEPPAELPEGVEYVRLPDRRSLRAIYNSCAVFLSASREEGWGLPSCEAMACGCALVTYDSGGSREFAHDGETAVVVEEHGAAELAAATLALLRDPASRVRLAEAGERLVSGFTWERSVDEFEAALRVGLAEAAA